MKASLFIVTFLIGVSVIAQNSKEKIRHQYLLTIANFENDSVAKKIDMVLDIVEDTTYFAEKKFIDFQNDIYEANTTRDPNNYIQLLSKANKKYDQSYYIMVKSTPTEIVTFEKFKKQKFFINEPRNGLIWNIDHTPIVWNHFTVKKATTICDGRQWTVYFTEESQDQSGPYKFNNLPGFVVKAWDATNHFVFEYVDTEELVDEHVYIHKPETYSELSVEEKKLLKEVFYPHLASSKNSASRSTGVKIHDIENPIDLSFVEENNLLQN